MGISNSDLLYLLLTSQRELLWAVYAFVQALENTGKPSYAELASQWQKWIDYTKTTGAKVSTSCCTQVVLS